MPLAESLVFLACLLIFFVGVTIVPVPLFLILNLSKVKRQREERERRLRAAEEERIRRFRAISNLQKLTPTGFEDYIAEIFREFGYRVKLRGNTNSSDRGIDIEARKENDYVVIQCKRHAPENKIGSKDIRNFGFSVINAGANKGVFVTTSAFTEPAKREVEGHPIELVDQNGIIEWQKQLKIGPYREVSPSPALPSSEPIEKKTSWLTPQETSRGGAKIDRAALSQSPNQKQGMSNGQVLILIVLTVIATVIFVCLALAVLGSLAGPPPG